MARMMKQLQDRGEEVLGRLAEAPGADRFVGAAGALTKRLDEMSKKVRGLEALEARLAKLERRLDKLDKPAARKPAPKKRAAAKPRPAAKKK
jgi:ubiquinone biosynthesis protein UbiJ